MCQGIPTTRAAALVVSSDLVKRDKFYDGNIRKERAAIVFRLAPSWFRIGSFELLAKSDEIDLLKQLSDFVINNYFPELSSAVNNRLQIYVNYYCTAYPLTLDLHWYQYLHLRDLYWLLDSSNLYK